MWLIFFVPIGWPGWLFIPGVCLIALNGLWMMLLLGTLCARFRDLPQIISSFVQVVFFMTPVIGRAAMNFNPFAALLAVARDPLIGICSISTRVRACCWDTSVRVGYSGAGLRQISHQNHILALKRWRASIFIRLLYSFQSTMHGAAH